MTRTALLSRSISRVCVAAPALCLLPACAELPLHAGLSDEVLHQRLAEYFPAGMTMGEVHTKLDELEVSRKFRTFYEQTPTAPAQLLVRLYEGQGGFWVHGGDEIVRWVDADFVFKGEARALERVETFPGSQRYFNGEPINFPDTPTKYPWRAFPMSPPPPAEGPVK